MKITEYIKDNSFKNGFSVHSPDPDGGFIAHYAGCGLTTGETKWMLENYFGYKHPLTEKTERKELPGGYSYETPSYKLAVRPENEEYVLRMELLSENEYDAPRRPGEPWPHFLISQRYSEKRHMDPVRPGLGELSKLIYSAKVKIEYCDCKLPDGVFDPGLHAAQVSHFFNITDPATDDYFWFGVPFFDVRTKSIGEYCNMDGGKEHNSGKMIYVPPQKLFTNADPNGNCWLEYEYDVLPLIKNAFEKVRAAGVMQNVAFKDLKITLCNFGFETPGTYNCALLVKKLSLLGYSED